MLVQTLEMALLFRIDVRWTAVVIFAPHIMGKTSVAPVEFRTVTEMPAGIGALVDEEFHKRFVCFLRRSLGL
jgi:hypothetical protein